MCIRDRALSGELTRTIKSISGVEDARVHVVLPDPSVFIDEQKQATAAVLIKTTPGYDLPSSSVKGIVNLVASSVEGLTPDKVTVVDASGRLLSQNLGHDYIGAGELPPNSVLELTSSTERELEERLLALLTPVLGPGNVVCQVRAEPVSYTHLDVYKRQRQTIISKFRPRLHRCWRIAS